MGMGLYDEQILSRIKNDRDNFDEAFFRLASVVTGDKRADTFLSDREKAQNAIEDILKYFHIVPTAIPDEIDSVDDQLEFLMRPSGIMRRRVELTGNWFKDGVGPLLGATKAGDIIALIPGKFTGYSFFDHNTGKNIKVTGNIAKEIEIDAYCFYKPMPPRKLGIPDLLKYMISALAVSDLAMIVTATLAITLLGMITPYATQLLFNNVIASGEMLQLLSISVLLFGAVFSTALINITGTIIMARIGSKIDISVQSAAMARVLMLPASFFKEYSSGDLAQRMQNLNQMCGTMAGITIKTMLSAVFSLLYIGQIAVFAPSLALPAFGIIVAGVAFTAISTFIATKVTRKEMTEKSKLSGLVFALFSGVQKIRLAGCEKRAFSKWAKSYEQLARCKFTPPILVRISPVISTAISAAGAVILFFTAGANNVPVANYMAFSSSYGMLSASMIMVANIVQIFATLKPILDMTKPILETEPEIAAGKKVITKLSGAIEVNNVSFRYRDDMPPILDDISLRIRAGQYVAIVGPSGCGKSTLLRLLLGFEKPEKGAIYYDGKDINTIDLKSLRKQIGCVIQNGKLMSGDIFSNIIISAPMLTLEDAWEAAELAGVAEDIRAMPMNMHTIVAEGGGGLSGGQKQRLMIARAIAPKPKILMLDEATSALDNITQKHVSESMNNLNCTRLVIAHRLSTIKQCNRIIYLEKGKILEDGTYEELIELGGKFAELVERQRLDQER